MKHDSYETYARTFPVYITVIPIVLAMFPILPEGFDWKFGGASAIVFLPLSYLCRQIGGTSEKGVKVLCGINGKGPQQLAFSGMATVNSTR